MADGLAVPAVDEWDDAPCGLLLVDARGIVRRVNQRFLNRTGYASNDMVAGRPWTQLMTAGSRLFYETQLGPVLELDGALEEVMVDLRGADGQRLPALLSATIVRDDSGRSVGTRVAVLTVPDRRKYEEDLRVARREAEAATAASGSARRRLEVLAQANAALASSDDVDVALRRLAAVLVAHLGDWCLIYASSDKIADQAVEWAGVHVDPDRQAALEQLARLLPFHASSRSALSRVLSGGTAVLLEEVSEQHKHDSTENPEVLDLYEVVGLESALVVPSHARGSRVATIILARGLARPHFMSDDLVDLKDLGARTGIVIDNLRRYAREHSNSVALQQALLTSAPNVPALEIATRYLPATGGAEVGGDWYDAFLLSDRTPVFVIGDVVGHDIQAAAAMGQLRGLIRSLAYALGGTPAQTLSAADDSARGLDVSTFATAVVARLNWSKTPGQASFEWSNAGHPPPVLIGADGDVRLLDAEPNLLLGVDPSTRRADHSVFLAAGDTVLMYTDGLVERSDEDLDVGVARLVGRLQGTHRQSVDEICEAALIDHAARRDDIALLAVRVTHPPR